MCPLSATPGKRVDLLTVKALLRESALRRLRVVQHGFCPDPTCAVVYFTSDGDTYSTGDVRVSVWHKEPFGQRTVCYCFGDNEADMRREIEMTGRSHAVDRVRAHIAAGRCACELRNPRGTCCLGDLSAAVTRVSTSAVNVTG